ncbi:hypothetical protein ACSNOK_08105 [Streptomyces sp. URMC 126]|uniref:hypothetical protein n=1 Tax=Streptomyces sp. URMC 126 TaxID=3423401 RepID=UPI003F1CFCFB
MASTIPTGRLVFVPQVQHLTLDVAEVPAGVTPERCSTEFGGRDSLVEDDGKGTITIRRRGPVHPFDLARRTAHVTLSPLVAWHVEVRGPAAHIEADLTGLPLLSLCVTGGLTQARFVLPYTDRTVAVHFGSGVRKTTIVRPPSVRATLRGDTGFTGLSLDGEWVGTRTEVDWRSAEPFEATPGCYDITLASGANRLTIA